MEVCMLSAQLMMLMEMGLISKDAILQTFML
jgi:hypothetical protein